MGKISQAKRWVIATACIYAMALNFSLTQFGKQTVVTYCDYHTERTGPPGEAVLPLANSVIDAFGSLQSVTEAERARRVCATATTHGLFGRPGIPRSFAIGLGLAGPSLALLAAAFAALQCFVPAGRAALILVLAALGGSTLALWLFYVLVISSTSAGALAMDALALVMPIGFLGGAFWLWRARPSRERT